MTITPLTRTAIITRKAIRYFFYGIILILILRVTINTGKNIYRYFFPEPPPPPSVGFSRLPELPYPNTDRPENLNLVLETPEGELPALADQMKVYFMPKVSPSLLSLDGAKQKAARLGFSTEGSQESQTIYTFAHEKVPAKLRINTVTGVFSISYDLTSDNSPLERRPSSGEVAESQIEAYLKSADLLPEDMTGPIVVEYLRLEEGKIVQALSLSEADLVKVNFFRKEFDEYSGLTATPERGNVWFVVGGSTLREKAVVTGEYHYFPIDETKYETYPIKTAQSAWEELKAEGGFIAQNSSITDEPVKIRRVYLAYYDAGVPTEFYQPIIVFEGDGGFVAYVPAVSPEYYGN